MMHLPLPHGRSCKTKSSAGFLWKRRSFVPYMSLTTTCNILRTGRRAVEAAGDGVFTSVQECAKGERMACT